ncbi:hypothetical protein GCM10008938_52270 [Deinococcus roseus]|uniref:Uncharacterized protein n=2 Tax=Deinococcus roseus TaxID=392414 RepID=A0ABQ2DJD4_9DEIO|nr:hypothetical protein GCM10008938_52270 [Deinococcus roseus]
MPIIRESFEVRFLEVGPHIQEGTFHCSALPGHLHVMLELLYRAKHFTRYGVIDLTRLPYPTRNGVVVSRSAEVALQQYFDELVAEARRHHRKGVVFSPDVWFGAGLAAVLMIHWLPALTLHLAALMLLCVLTGMVLSISKMLHNRSALTYAAAAPLGELVGLKWPEEAVLKYLKVSGMQESTWNSLYEKRVLQVSAGGDALVAFAADSGYGGEGGDGGCE